MSRIARQHLRVVMPDGQTSYDVHTSPFDHDLAAITGKKHGWPSPSDNPVGYLLFLSWSASRRAGAIEPTMTWEKFREVVEDIETLDSEDVTPTPPVPGAG